MKRFSSEEEEGISGLIVVFLGSSVVGEEDQEVRSHTEDKVSD